MLLRKLAAQVLKTAEEHKLQGHTEVQGISVAIENRRGSVREGTTEDGHHWRTKMKFPYGYLEGTKAKDGEEVDAFVGPDKDAPNAYVVHQHKPDGTGFDEDKVMLGFGSEEEARKAYLQHYDDPKFLGPISTVPVEKLKEKIEAGGVLKKISYVVGSIAGPSGSGKTTLLRQLQEKHPGLITKDTDAFHDAVRAEMPEFSHKVYPEEYMGQVRGKLHAFLEENQDRPVLLGGGMSKVVPTLGVPTENRWLLDTGPLVSAWRRYRRKNERPWVGPVGERLGKITEIPGDYLKNREGIKKIKERGYQAKSPAEIEKAVGEALSMRKLAAEAFFLPTKTRPSSLPPLKRDIGKYWHTGIVHDDKVYETFNQGRHRVASLAKRGPELIAQGAEFLPAQVDPLRLRKEIRSGTSCDEFVLRVTGHSNRSGADKGKKYPDDVHQALAMRKIAAQVLCKASGRATGAPEHVSELPAYWGPSVPPGSSGSVEKLAEDTAWLEKLADRVKPKGIKFLYINTGGGHKAQAHALAEAAQKMGIPAETMDWKEHFAKGPHLANYEKAYAKLMHGEIGQLGVALPAAKFTFLGTDHDKLRNWVDQNKDQAIVVTMEHLKKEFKGIDHPVHILHSDPVVWPFAQSGGKDPNRIDMGLPSVLKELGAKTRIPIANVPVAQSVLRPKGKSGLIEPKKFNVTVSGGSLGAEVVPLTQQVLQADLPEGSVIHAVAGRNSQALRELRTLAKRDPRLRAHGFAPLSSMMHEADLNVIRTHGTTFAETVAAGKPAVYYGPNVRFGLLQDGQGDLTKRTAIYAGKQVGNPTAIGMGAVTGAVDKAIDGYDRLLVKARKAKAKMGDPAREAVRQIMKPRPGYVKTATIEEKQLRKGTPVAVSFDEFRKRLRPGDVILTKPSEAADLESKDRALRGTVKFYDWLSGAKHPGWTHTALYLGDGQIAHLHDKKLQRGTLKPMGEGINRVVQDKLDVFRHQGYDLAAIRPRVGAASAVQQMKAFSDDPVDISVGKFTRNLIRTGLTPFGGKAQQDAVCSGIVGAAFSEPLAKRKPFSMRPKDFLESKKVDHVVGFSPDQTLRKVAALVLKGK